jgi:hypothetical protein
MAALLVGSIGCGIFIYGKRQRRIPQLLCGLSLIAFPYFVASAGWMLAIAAALIAATWFAVRAGL